MPTSNEGSRFFAALRMTVGRSSPLCALIVTMAPMLLFKKKFLPAIRCGEKTQTIRLWKWRMMRSGQRSYVPGVGYIAIDGVEQVKLEDLTDADAAPDGFATADALRHELQSI